jgi:hypothetical protein
MGGPTVTQTSAFINQITGFGQDRPSSGDSWGIYKWWQNKYTTTMLVKIS